MNANVPDWPEVSVDRFMAVMDSFRRIRKSAWSNTIEYIDTESGQIVGYEDGCMKPYRYLLHPGLAEVTN